LERLRKTNFLTCRFLKQTDLKILILGSGGREHAITWKLSQSSEDPALYIAPGNAGTLELGENVDLDPNDFKAVKEFCLKKQIDMVIVGPEEPLVKGIYDFFKNDSSLQHIIITGPSAHGAQLEGSKAFAKSFMKRHHIPTAAYREFDVTKYEEGLEYISRHPMPVVLKADGLAAGKGVVICENAEDAAREFSAMLKDEKFGQAGKKVVIEQFLKGIELSVFVATDGRHYVLLPEAKDYKKIGEGDTGLNTGGMGAVSPVPFATNHFMQKVVSRIIEPTIDGLQKEEIDYRGFIFFGLINVDEDPYVIEYNCRLGDPETEVILLRLENDLIDIIRAMHNGTMDKVQTEFSQNNVVTVMAVSGGYPQKYQKGFPVEFRYLKNHEEIKHLTKKGGVIVFHAATKPDQGKVVTNGGRVLTVSASSTSLPESLEIAEEILRQIHFEGMYYRGDIGNEFVK